MELETIQLDDISEQETLQINQGAGYCEVCGADTGDKRRKWCDEHKDTKGKLPSIGATTKRRGNSKNAATNGELADVFGKIIVLITVAFAWSQLRKFNVRDPGGQFAERAGMTDDESEAVAVPIARAFNSTAVGVRYGRKIVDNSDLIDAGFAVYEWYSRQGRMFQELSQQIQAQNNGQGVPQPSRNERQQDDEPATANEDIRQQQGTVVDIGYLRDAESI